MSKQHAEWKLRAAECHQAALAAMERASSVTNSETKAEFLNLATEFLKLAEDIERFLGMMGEKPLLN